MWKEAGERGKGEEVRDTSHPQHRARMAPAKHPPTTVNTQGMRKQDLFEFKPRIKFKENPSSLALGNKRQAANGSTHLIAYSRRVSIARALFEGSEREDPQGN